MPSPVNGRASVVVLDNGYDYSDHSIYFVDCGDLAVDDVVAAASLLKGYSEIARGPLEFRDDSLGTLESVLHLSDCFSYDHSAHKSRLHPAIHRVRLAVRRALVENSRGLYVHPDWLPLLEELERLNAGTACGRPKNHPGGHLPEPTGCDLSPDDPAEAVDWSLGPCGLPLSIAGSDKGEG